MCSKIFEQNDGVQSFEMPNNRHVCQFRRIIDCLSLRYEKLKAS